MLVTASRANFDDLHKSGIHTPVNRCESTRAKRAELSLLEIKKKGAYRSGEGGGGGGVLGSCMAVVV